ncbi:MAG TPA: hypothetical protein VFA26_22760 [Gemmataceae bacterium]|nr:hypothetical protein [Gemmataceae bacterium]
MSTDTTRISPPDYPVYVGALRTTDPDLARNVEAFTGIGQVLDWMQRQGLNLRTIDFVSQDEFEYDFLLELESGGRWLAFGVT